MRYYPCKISLELKHRILSDIVDKNYNLSNKNTLRYFYVANI